MQIRKRHPEPKSRTIKAKAKKKPAPRAKSVRTLHGIPLTAPIFNGLLAGKHSVYIRPFDSVWPTEEERVRHF